MYSDSATSEVAVTALYQKTVSREWPTVCSTATFRPVIALESVSDQKVIIVVVEMRKNPDGVNENSD
jgi:hypothetical protein